VSPPSFSFSVDNLTAEKGDEASSSQALSEGNQADLKEILSLLQRDIQDQVRDVDHLEEVLESINQELPDDIKASLVLCKSTRIHFHHLMSSLPASPREKPPKPWRTRGNSQSRRAAPHQRTEPFESQFSFSILSLAFDCNLMIHLPLFSSLTCSQKRSLELKRFLSTSSLIPLLKKKTPRRNRRPTTNCAVASGI
jgi:hypothetical protein